MFEGVSDQLHQFITPRTSSLPLPLNFSLHPSSNNSSPNFNFHPFDSYNGHHQISLQPHILHPLLHQSPSHKNGDDREEVESCNLQVAMDLEVGRAETETETERSSLLDHHQWSNDEVLSLLRIRSNMENWFPESTWEHVSRKLGEFGYRRTAEKCKEKFEEESRFFNNFNYNNKSSRFLSELYQDNHPLFHGGDQEKPTGSVLQEENKVLRKEQEEEEGEGDSRNETTVLLKKRQNIEEIKSKSCIKTKRMRKTMRQKEFEMLKVFCEDIVKKMMVQQEEIHTKLLHDMLKREEDKIGKEESWKKQQMDRLHKELEVMAHEQAIAGDRQATIIEILNQITNSTSFSTFEAKKELRNLLQSLNATSPSSSLIQAQTSSPTCGYDKNKQKALASPVMVLAHENSNSFTSQNDPNNPNPTQPTVLAPQDPNSFIKHQNNPSNPTSLSFQKVTQNPKTNEKEFDDLGKRWPRDEVLALVNVRCSLYSNGGDQESGEGSSKAPLWERISQGMLELGYKRSAKRCKEKWENINKYFRKTKDVNKKRSLDSRTCPYFHQLSTLYNQGGSNVVTSTSMKQPENCLNSSENHSEISENLPTNPFQRS